jgi:hypothetical protein
VNVGGPELVIVILYVAVIAGVIRWMISVASSLRRISEATGRIAKSLETSEKAGVPPR